MNQKEAALREEGASAPEAAAGGRCSLQVDVLDEGLDKSKGLYVIDPLMPENMRQKGPNGPGCVLRP